MRDPKRRSARVRTELHRLLAALSRRDWDEAGRAIFVREGAESWTPERLESALEPYFTAHPLIDLSPRARRPDRTVITPEGAKLFRVQQRFGPPPKALRAHQAVAADPGAAAQAEALLESDEADWTLECLVDLELERPADAPLIDLLRIGS